jgi:hypothetical protein
MRRSHMKIALISAAAVMLMLSVAGVPRADAVSYTFDVVGDTTTFNFSKDVVSGGNTYTLSAAVQYELISQNSFSSTLKVTVSNTSTTGTNEGISSTGFVDSHPEILTASISQVDGTTLDTDKFVAASTYVTFPGFSNVDLCLFTSSNCSSAATSSRLAEGKYDTFYLNLVYLGTASSFTITDPVIRFAGDLDSHTFGSNAPVPEPSTVLLLGVGLLGAGMWKKRRSVHT